MPPRTHSNKSSNVKHRKRLTHVTHVARIPDSNSMKENMWVEGPGQALKTQFNAVEAGLSGNQKQQKLADAKEYGHGQTRLSIIFYREVEEITENLVALSQEKASFAFSVTSSHKPSIAWHIRQIQWWASWNVHKLSWIAGAAAILVNQKVPVRFVISSKRTNLSASACAIILKTPGLLLKEQDESSTKAALG